MNCVICAAPVVGRHPSAKLCGRAQCQREYSRARQRAWRGPRPDRTCAVCGITFPARNNAVTCSPACARARRLGKTLEEVRPPFSLAESETCDVCGAVFRPRIAGQRGCSPECMKIGRLRRQLARCRKGPYPLRPCAVCGASFVPERRNRVVCGNADCRAQYKRDCARARASGAPSVGDTAIHCAVCGVEFRGHPNAMVCSAPCLKERQKQLARQRLGIEPCICIACGAAFWPPYPGQHYTCSAVCQEAAASAKARRAQEYATVRRQEQYRLRLQRQLADAQTAIASHSSQCEDRL